MLVDGGGAFDSTDQGRAAIAPFLWDRGIRRLDVVVATNAFCDNDLPRWYKPSTGATSTASTSPGLGWFTYPCTRTYTVEQFAEDLTTRVLTPGTYGVKLLTVVVRPTSGPFPGLRQTTQSVYVRFRDASPN